MSSADDEALDRYRLTVREVIARSAPGVGAREGHRAPTSAEEEQQLRRWFSVMFDEGLAGAGWPEEWGGRVDHHPLHSALGNKAIIVADGNAECQGLAVHRN